MAQQDRDMRYGATRRCRGYAREVVLMWLFIVLFVAGLAMVRIWRENNQEPGAAKGPTVVRTAPKSNPVNGTGSTLLAPLYQSLRTGYLAREKENPVKLPLYRPNSTAEALEGIRQGDPSWVFSERPMTKEERMAANAFQFPFAAAGVAIVTNIEGIKPGQLKLSRKNLVAIFAGKLKQWNAPAIRADNPDLKLPETPILVFLRGETCGANFILNNYLCALSDEWKSTVGATLPVKWPFGTESVDSVSIVAEFKSQAGAVSWFEASEAVKSGLQVALLENEEKQYVAPSRAGIEAGIAFLDDAAFDDCVAAQVKIPGKASYPLVGVNYAILPLKKDASFVEKSARVEFWDMMNWLFGQNEAAKELEYQTVFFPKRTLAKIHNQYYEASRER